MKRFNEKLLTIKNLKYGITMSALTIRIKYRKLKFPLAKKQLKTFFEMMQKINQYIQAKNCLKVKEGMNEEKEKEEKEKLYQVKERNTRSSQAEKLVEEYIRRKESLMAYHQLEDQKGLICILH